MSHLQHARIAVLAILVSAGCASVALQEEVAVGQPPEGFGIVETHVSRPLGGFPVQGGPIQIPGQAAELIPYARTERKHWWRDSDRFDEGGEVATSKTSGRGRSMTAEVRWHNAVLRNRDTGEQTALLSKRGVISRFWIVGSPGRGRDSRTRALLFAVTTDDTNGDRWLDNRDGARLLVMDASGGSRRLVTPEGTHLHDVRLDVNAGTAVLMLREDRDGDGRFEETEMPVPYLVDLDGTGSALRLLEASTEESMDALLR